MAVSNLKSEIFSRFTFSAFGFPPRPVSLSGLNFFMDAESVSQDQARPEDQPKPQEPIPTHRGIGTWSLWFFMAPVIYILSIGPAAKLEQVLHLPQKAPTFDNLLVIIYSPVIWCVVRSPTLFRAFDWYLYRVWHLKTN